MAALALDRLFPPDLSRMAAMGTEVRDHQGRTLALLPTPGGVWRFRASAEAVSPVLRDLLIAVDGDGTIMAQEGRRAAKAL